MAEFDRGEPSILQHTEDEHEDSDNESNNLERTQSFTRLESDIKDQMSTIATQVKDSILGLNDQMQRKFSEFDTKMQQMQARFKEQSNPSLVNQPSTSTSLQHNDNTNNESSMGGQSSVSSDLLSNKQSITHTGESQPGLSNSTLRSKGDNSVKLKPQKFSETDDFEDFLTQFEITAEINEWGYKAKSLYLANSLTGSARSLLNELTSEQRRDYSCLVQKLQARYGCENRAEVFRAQLKSKLRAKGETIPELAQAVKKLTRQSYPNASLDVIEALALDHFIDALSESEIRLRLREVGPKTLSEAEKIAVRMEAHRIADKQRTRFVGKVEQEISAVSNSQKSLENQITDINKNITSLQKTVQSLMSSKYGGNQSHGQSNTAYRSDNRANGSRPWANNHGWNPQYRGDNPRQNQQNRSFPPNRNQPNRQGNASQSNQGSGFRLN